MKRIDTAAKALDLFGPGKHGFKDGNPVTGDPATSLNAAWFNSAQEEICNVIEGAGIALDGANRAQLLEAVRRIGGPRGLEVFTVPGAVSWAVPAGVYSVEVEVWGGGGGGGGAHNGGQSGGGGGAGYCRQRLAVTPGATIPGFVGAGGAGGAGTPAAGAPGEDTWFGSTSFLARGGPGGLAGNGSSGGPVPGGGTVGGDEAIAGQPGSGAFGTFGGSGGSAARGGAGAPAGSSGGPGGGGVAPGGGGGGTAAGISQGYAGGAGASGRIVIRW